MLICKKSVSLIYIVNMAVRRTTTEDPFVTADNTLDELIDARLDARLRGWTTPSTAEAPVTAATRSATGGGSSEFFERHVRGPNPEEREDNSVADWVLIVGGIFVFLYFLNKVCNYIYFRAICNIDMANRHREYGSTAARFWRTVEVVLRHGWIPLWFTHNDIFHNAIRVNLDQEHQRVRLQNMMDQGNPVPMLRFQDMLHGHVIDTENRNGTMNRYEKQQQAQPVALPQRSGPGQALAQPVPAVGEGVRQLANAAIAVPQNPPTPELIPRKAPVARFVRVPEQTRIVFDDNIRFDRNTADRNHQPEVGRGIELTDDDYYEQPIRGFEIYRDQTPAVRRVSKAPVYQPG